jgi:aryl-alcohol dehydrogenase-like predicted oxidoreductase
LDLVQFHWWDFDIPGYVEAAHHLVDLQKAGKIHHIGVTNFDAEHLTELLDAGVPVVSNQVQYSLLDSRPERAMADLSQKHGFKLLCYGTLAGGFLTDRWLHKELPSKGLENRSLIKYRLIVDEFGGQGLFQELLDVIAGIADRRSVSIADVAIRYVLQKPSVGGVIIGARNSRHLSRLINVFRSGLANEDLEEIEEVVFRAAGPVGPVFGLERERQGPHGRIMKYNLGEERSG